jgi:hypothetical protein
VKGAGSDTTEFDVVGGQLDVFVIQPSNNLLGACPVFVVRELMLSD